MSTSLEPLIYTKNGNVPIASLTSEVEWIFSDTYVQLIERYRDASGDIVKEGAHVYCKAGVAGMGIPGDFGGK